VVGICGGFQMLASRITDHVESADGSVDGLGLLDVEIEFAARKTLARPIGTALDEPVTGYEIHHGTVVRRADELRPLVYLPDGAVEGAVSGPVVGTHWHGLFENDAFRRRFLRWAARQAGRDGFAPAGDTDFAAVRAGQLDLLGDLVEKHLDTDAIARLLDHGVPAGLPTLRNALGDG